MPVSGKFATFFWKLENFPIRSWKIRKISNLKSIFFQVFQKERQISLKPGNLFFPNCIWANFEQDQSIFVDSDFRGDFFVKKFMRDFLVKWAKFLKGISLKNYQNPIRFWNFWNFLSKTPSRRGLFFRKKRSSDLAQTSLRWSSDKINFELFGTCAIFFGKLEKNPIPS